MITTSSSLKKEKCAIRIKRTTKKKIWVPICLLNDFYTIFCMYIIILCSLNWNVRVLLFKPIQVSRSQLISCKPQVFKIWKLDVGVDQNINSVRVNWVHIQANCSNIVETFVIFCYVSHSLICNPVFSQAKSSQPFKYFP